MKPPIERRGLRGRQTPDIEYVDTLRAGGGWMTAAQVAKLHGHSLYAVARVFARQVEIGAIEEEIVEVMGVRRAREQTRVYRARLQPGELRRVNEGMPAWLAPQAIAEVGERVVVFGRAGIAHRSLDGLRPLPDGSWAADQDDGMPGAPEKGAASAPIDSDSSEPSGFG
jgi:hypothetical protein